MGGGYKDGPKKKKKKKKKKQKNSRVMKLWLL
jgi:hypothetical protein